MRLCWMVRKVTGWWVDELEALPAWVHRHLSRCESCREQLEAERSLARDLRHTADRQREAVPAVVERRIAAYLGGAARVNRRQPSYRRMGWQMAIGLATLVILTVVLRQVPWEPPAGTLATGSTPLVPVDDWPPVVYTSPEQVGAWSRMIEQPLEEELVLAMNDGQRLLASMIQSVVPEPYAESLLTRAEALFVVPPGSD